MIYVKVWQPEDYPLIEIQLSTGDLDKSFTGYVAARKSVDPQTWQLAPAHIKPNISYQGEFTPDDARETSELWRIAAKTAETLDKMVKIRLDLSRPITARMTVKTVVLEWQD